SPASPAANATTRVSNAPSTVTRIVTQRPCNSSGAKSITAFIYLPFLEAMAGCSHRERLHPTTESAFGLAELFSRDTLDHVRVEAPLVEDLGELRSLLELGQGLVVGVEQFGVGLAEGGTGTGARGILDRLGHLDAGVLLDERTQRQGGQQEGVSTVRGDRLHAAASSLHQRVLSFRDAHRLQDAFLEAAREYCDLQVGVVERILDGGDVCRVADRHAVRLGRDDDRLGVGDGRAAGLLHEETGCDDVPAVGVEAWDHGVVWRNDSLDLFDTHGLQYCPQDVRFGTVDGAVGVDLGVGRLVGDTDAQVAVGHAAVQRVHVGGFARSPAGCGGGTGSEGAGEQQGCGGDPDGSKYAL